MVHLQVLIATPPSGMLCSPCAQLPLSSSCWTSNIFPFPCFNLVESGDDLYFMNLLKVFGIFFQTFAVFSTFIFKNWIAGNNIDDCAALRSCNISGDVFYVLYVLHVLHVLDVGKCSMCDLTGTVYGSGHNAKISTWNP